VITTAEPSAHHLPQLKVERSLSLDADISDHDAFPSYGPSFTLDVPAGNMRDENTEEYLLEVERVYSQIVDRLRML